MSIWFVPMYQVIDGEYVRVNKEDKTMKKTNAETNKVKKKKVINMEIINRLFTKHD